MLYIITEPCIVNHARYVLITTFKTVDDGYVSDKEYLCVNIDMPCTSNGRYNLFNMLTDYKYVNSYLILNPYMVLRENALFIDNTGLNINKVNKLKNTVCMSDIRKEIRDGGN